MIRERAFFVRRIVSVYHLAVILSNDWSLLLKIKTQTKQSFMKIILGLPGMSFCGMRRWLGHCYIYMSFDLGNKGVVHTNNSGASVCDFFWKASMDRA